MLLVSSLISCGTSDAPDTIFVGGTVLTVDNADTVVEAVATKDGLIVQTGTKTQLLATADSNTQIIDLTGKTLVPGFIASHEHPTLSAVFANTVDLSGFSFGSQQSMWQNLRDAVNKTEKGEWVYAMGLDPVLMPDLILPNKQFLDEIAPDNPLFVISQTMHSFWANSLAFKQIGIDKNSADPGNGSYYGKNASGELNGFISESTAADPFMEKLKSPFAVIERYQNTLKDLLSSGFTSVASVGYNIPPMAAKYASSDNYEPRIRQFIYLTAKELQYLPDAPENDDDYYQILGIKLWHDGSPYTGTMALSQPYLNNELTATMGIGENHKGESRLSVEDFENQVREYSQSGWQLAVHSQGDQSNRDSLKVFRSALAKDGKKLRHRFEHCLLIPESTLTDFKPLGLTPSFHINHIYYYGDALSSSIIGPQRAQQILPLKTAFDLGLHPTIHADSPMFPTDVLSLMKTAVLRKTKSGKVLGHNQAINVQQALRSVTINAAWQLHMEEKIGSIEVGKYADFTLLSDNLYDLPPEQWKQIKIEQVWLAGKPKL